MLPGPDSAWRFALFYRHIRHQIDGVYSVLIYAHDQGDQSVAEALICAPDSDQGAAPAVRAGIRSSRPLSDTDSPRVHMT